MVTRMTSCAGGCGTLVSHDEADRDQRDCHICSGPLCDDIYCIDAHRGKHEDNNDIDYTALRIATHRSTSMGWDVQINPAARARGISPELATLLSDHVQDFEIRYGSLEPDPALIAALRAFQPHSLEERDAVAEMLTSLESGDAVELLLGH